MVAELRKRTVLREKKRFLVLGAAAFLGIITTFYYNRMGLESNTSLNMVQTMQLYFGGPEVRDSLDILRIMCYFIPICIVASVLADDIIQEFTSNFVTIFTRTGKRTHYYNQIIKKILGYLAWYHIFVIIGSMAMERPTLCSGSEWIQVVDIIMVSFLQYTAIILLNQVIFLYMREPFSGLIGYAMLLLPIFIVGALYKDGSNLVDIILWVPFNQGIYNYQKFHMAGLFCQIVLVGIIYCAGYYKMKNYEVI